MKTSLLLAAIFIMTGCTSTPTLAPRSEEPAQTSPVVKPISGIKAIQLQRPEVVLENMNRNFETRQNACAEYLTQHPRGHYYCSGVLGRGVIDGNFNPWSYSPHATEVGATSWFWLRQDSGVKGVVYSAGMLLRNKMDAIEANIPGVDQGLICLYPFDAGTGPQSGHNGCGLDDVEIPPAAQFKNVSRPLKPTSNADAWGSCPQVGVTNAIQWGAFRKLTGRQCSWNVENQEGWNAMLTIRKGSSAVIWNELMLKNEDEGNHMPQYIGAFFYQSEREDEGLTTARSFQTKLYNAGFIVPILRMDLQKAHNPFSYVEADQAIAQ